MTPEQRFWKKVDNSGGPDTCWLWSATLNGGYGQFWAGKFYRAHRFSMMIHTGLPIPAGMRVLHRPKICKSKACVNPKHLYIGTDSENMLDTVLNGTNYWTNRTTCKNGHDLDRIGKQRGKKGVHRYCQICATERQRVHRNKQKRQKLTVALTETY